MECWLEFLSRKLEMLQVTAAFSESSRDWTLEKPCKMLDRMVSIIVFQPLPEWILERFPEWNDSTIHFCVWVQVLWPSFLPSLVTPKRPTQKIYPVILLPHGRFLRHHHHQKSRTEMQQVSAYGSANMELPLHTAWKLSETEKGEERWLDTR